jgi:hypothetical protein
MSQEENFRINYNHNKPVCVVYYTGDLLTHLHRENGPAVIHSDGSKFWYLNNKRHREDGPAVESGNGDRFWYKNGLIHREYGPALKYANGNKYWYLNGIRFE